MSRALSVIDDMLGEIRRQVDVLIQNAAEKAAHIRRLNASRQTPIVASDYPAREWAAIAERQQAIDVLVEARRRIKQRPASLKRSEGT